MSGQEPTRAYVEYDPMMLGVRIAVVRPHHVLKWQPITVEAREERAGNIDPDVWLRLPEDDARAMYEALADHFGHAGHDIRALRKDYDAERKRVDTFITHLTGRTS